ncbi:DUF2490 domain-containing protein [Hymenobacter sediminicola]|uniref:DUF2490 domain-containing protein n=1 Tax=Hymenobacter sediminicola TaxID=2761579 RepID=A0A7G7W9Z8_9BACT|nr:DUF2490 domain-containing protein [Hymenobacter sediminicola]QNH63191.1 DUF2490 domain-containing protein [Hymenobacter sediminicola]
MRVSFLPMSLLCLLPVVAGAQSAPPARIQDPNRNVWLAWFSDARLTKRWGLHTEFQLRRTHGLRDPQQYFYRVGANYHATDRLTLTPGYVYLLSLPYGDFPDASRTHERRFYLRADLEDELGRLQLTHRYIQDFRWLLNPGETSYARQYRSRYRLQLQFPLTGPKIEAGTLYGLASDEIFISYGSNAARLFNQNRLYGGLGYQATEALSLEASYLHQTVQHDDGVVFEQNHALQISVNFNPDFRKQKGQ